MSSVSDENRVERPAGSDAGDDAVSRAAGPQETGAGEFPDRLHAMMADLAGAWATGAGNAAGAAVEAMGELAGKVRFEPTRMVEAQMQLWEDYQRLWMGTTTRLLQQASPAEPVIEPAPGDLRFRDAEWTENPVFDYIKQAYLLNAAWGDYY